MLGERDMIGETNGLVLARSYALFWTGVVRGGDQGTGEEESSGDTGSREWMEALEAEG
jgi:hypothetical protein